MKKKSSSIATGLVLALLCIPALAFPQEALHTKGFVFTDFDFQIIENFIRLNVKLSGQECPTLNYRQTPLQFQYHSNCNGWKAIRIIEKARASHDYYLNHEITGGGTTDRTQVTIVTSHGGELTDQKAIHHFLTIIEDIKLALLVPEYFNSLFRFLLMNGKEGDAFIFQGNMISINTLGPSVRSIEVTPASNDHFPYRIEQRITRRKSKIRWQYLVPLEKDLPDDLFFSHYTDLLLTAKHSSIPLSVDTTFHVER